MQITGFFGRRFRVKAIVAWFPKKKTLDCGVVFDKAGGPSFWISNQHDTHPFRLF